MTPEEMAEKYPLEILELALKIKEGLGEENGNRLN